MHSAPAKQVDMKVVDRLSAVSPGVDHRAEAVRQAMAAGNLRRDEVQVSYQFLVFGARFGQRANVSARHDHDMRGRLRIDVVKCASQIVLKDHLRRNLAGNNFAE